MSTTTTKFNLVKPELTDSADITAMNPNWDKIDKHLSEGFLAEATSTDGISYTATIDGITELYNGLTIRIIPNRLSGSTTPTLNVNGLGDVRIAILSDVNNAAVVPPTLPTWLSAKRPVELTYHEVRSTVTDNITNTYWIVEYRRTSVSALYGILKVEGGGTGGETAQEARTNLEVSQAIEDNTHSGCYYRVVDEETEWINPPMELEVEYRTTKRYRGQPIYVKRMYLGLSTSGTTSAPSTRTVAIGVSYANVIRSEVMHYSANTQTTEFLPCTANNAIAYIYWFNGTDIKIKSTGGTSGYQTYLYVEYIK